MSTIFFYALSRQEEQNLCYYIYLNISSLPFSRLLYSPRFPFTHRRIAFLVESSVENVFSTWNNVWIKLIRVGTLNREHPFSRSVTSASDYRDTCLVSSLITGVQSLVTKTKSSLQAKYTRLPINGRTPQAMTAPLRKLPYS